MTVSTPPPSERLTFASARRVTLPSASAPVPPGTPSAPKVVIDSNAKSPVSSWPSSASLMPVPAMRTYGPPTRFSATLSPATVSVSLTAAWPVLIASANVPVKTASPGSERPIVPCSVPARPAAVISSAPPPLVSEAPAPGVPIE